MNYSLTTRAFIGSKPKAKPNEGRTKARMEFLMKKVAGNVLEKTRDWKEKVAKFIELSDEETEEEQ